MASALTFPLFENGHEIRHVGSPLDDEIIDRLKEDNYHLNLQRNLHDGIKYYHISEVDEALEGTDLVLGGVSSFGVDWFADNVLELIPEGVPLLSVTKGLYDYEDGTLVNYLEYWESKQPEGKNINFNAIGGPCEAKDLADGDHSYVAFCGNDAETLEWLRDLFATDYYIVSLTQDTVGLEGAVALKNAYALAVSLADGMKKANPDDGVAHKNRKSALVQQSIREMLQLLDILGAHKNNIMFAAADMDVTVQAGRTRRLGNLLGQGYTSEEALKQLEGVTLESVVVSTRTARAVKNLAKAGKVDTADFPLLMHVDALINGGETVDIPWKEFEQFFAWK
jgi:glycerol-3-phosphate dehydrogenase (NAD(P)+)